MSTAESPTTTTPVGHQGARVDITQRPAVAINGWLGVLVLAGCIAGMVITVQHDTGLVWLPVVVFALVISSLAIVTPGQTSVVQFFGRYIGTVLRPGFWWVLPLTVRRRVSIRVRNFETNRLKVNDADGNPVEIAAIVVWQVADTAKSTYAVDSYLDFVSVQAESALRHVATSHPYDDATDSGSSLRGSTDVVGAELAREVAERVSHCRGRDRGGPDLAPRLRPGDCAGDAAPPAGQRRRRGPLADRRRRGRDGGAGAQPAHRERRGVPRRGADRQHGEQPDGRSLWRSAAVSDRQRRFALYVSKRRQVLLRLDPAVHDALIRWANDEFRSVNAHVEMLLRRALTDAARMPKHAAPLPKRGRPRARDGTPAAQTTD